MPPARRMWWSSCAFPSDEATVAYGATITNNILSGWNFGYGYAIDGVDSMIAFIPHNNVLYVWYRLGIVGEIILWSIVGCGILAGCRFKMSWPPRRSR